MDVPVDCIHEGNNLQTQSEMENTNPVTLFELNNQDVRWDGTVFGLQPFLSLRAVPFSQKLSKNEMKELKLALKDPERFILAHVLLTMNIGVSYNVDASQWNGLCLSLRADNSVICDVKQMPKLLAFWNLN